METFPGRCSVRLRKGSTRPPGIPPELWQRISSKRKQIAIAEYEQELADARNAHADAPPASVVAPAVTATIARRSSTEDSDSYVPRLPLQSEPDAEEPHRDKSAWHPPCCIARKLSRKEMTTDPKAQKALDAEWEKLRFLKRPHPTPGVGAGDEGNIREAASVRKEAQRECRTVHFARIV